MKNEDYQKPYIELYYMEVEKGFEASGDVIDPWDEGEDPLDE